MSDQVLADKKPREFIAVSPAEAKTLLLDGVKHLASAIIWTKDQKHVINTHLSLVGEADGLLHAIAPKGFSPEKFMDELARLEDHDCFFSVSLVRANVFFKTQFVGGRKTTLVFRMPQKVFKVQRRSEIRFMIPDGYVLKAEFQDPLFAENRHVLRVYDISAGGCSFLVDPSEKSFYQPGLVLRDLEFTVRGRTIKIDGEIRHISDIPNNVRLGPATKVGVQFRNIRPGDAQQIASYVFEESRKFYSRFL